MNYFRDILACGNNGFCGGGNGRYAIMQKDDDDTVWREPLVCDDEPSLPPPVPRIIRFNFLQMQMQNGAVPRIIRFDFLQMQMQNGANEDDDEHLVGLAFVGDTKDRETSFEAFTEMEDPDSVEQSIEDLQVSTWSSFPSLSTDEDDDDDDDDDEASIESWFY
jgi:hypothetical protein